MVAAVHHIVTVPAVYGGLSVVAAVYLHNYRLSYISNDLSVTAVFTFVATDRALEWFITDFRCLHL